MANPAENNVKNESPAQENKMGVMPVGKLLFTMSLPIMISMLVQALYNVVDSMFVARVSENALTALSMAFPIQNLMIAVSTGLGVGLNAVLSRALGAKDEKGVNRAATNGIMLLFICGLVFMLGGATIVRPYFEMQTDIAEIVESGVDYTTIVMLGSMGVFMQILFERLLQSTGRTLLTMVSQGVGAIANIILDPIFIFGLFGVPKMGVAGAAYATILGQWIAAAIGLVMNIRKNPEVSISMKPARRDDPPHPLYRYSVGGDAVHRLDYDLPDEPDSHRVLRHGGSGVRRVFQAPELCVHAGVRPEQRHGADCGV